MDMTFETYSSKMFSILETAIYNYEINVLVEDAEGPEAAEKKESKLANLKAVAAKIWSNIWKAIKSLFQTIAAKANELINSPVTVTEEDGITIYPGATKFDGTLMRYANEFAAGKIDNVDDALTYMDKVQMTDKFAKGTEVPTRGIAGTVKKYIAAIERLEKVTFNGDNEDLKTAQTAIKRIIGILTSYANQAKKLLSAKATQTAEEIKAKAESKAAKMASKDDKETATNESVDDSNITLSARLILEAANLLREDAEDHVDGIEGGEGTQDPIDDIPEEKPETTGEYPAEDVTGGEGAPIDQKEVKELVEDDKEAIDILNDDEGGKAVQTESVVIHF